MKFGGSSVGSLRAMRQAAALVRSERERDPIVVVSALQGVTDALAEAGVHAEKGDAEKMLMRLASIAARHEEIITSSQGDGDILRLGAELERLLLDVAGRRAMTDADWASLLSFGERMSVGLVADVFRREGVESQAVDARELLVLTGDVRNARVDFAKTRERTVSFFGGWSKGTVPIVTGFIGETEDGRTALLGRGGSDYTASILGEALGAVEIMICKDVDGILSADPRIVEEAGLLSRISYDEAAEMSYFGAKVLHPKTMIPAVRARIPIRIRNTFDASAPGTLVSEDSEDAPEGVKSVSAHRGLAMIALEGKGMAGIAGFAAEVFSVVGRLGVNILMFTQASSEQTICLVVESDEGDRLRRALAEAYGDAVESGTIEAIRVLKDVAAIAVVGDGMKGRRGIAGKVFGAVADADVNVLAIAQGSSERNISFIVEGRDADAAVRGVHASLMLSVKTGATSESYA